MECLSICIYSRCIKKAQSLAEADPLLFLNNYLHTLTLAYRDLLSGNKKRFCLATDTIKVLSSSGWTSARSPGHLQTLHTPSWSDTGDGWTGMWVSGGRFVGEEGVERWGILYSLTRGWAEAPAQQQLPPFWRHKTKRAPSVPPASGPPSLPRGRAHQSPERSPQSSPPLSSSSCPVLFVQPGRITWSRGRTRGPNHPGLTAFTCDPHS